MSIKHIALAAVAAASMAASAQAAMVTVNAASPIVAQTTNWSNNLTFDKFDSSLGTLTEVKVKLFGGVQGVAKAESLDGGPATINLNLAATVTLTRPDNSTIIIVIPAVNNSFSATAFDGVIDFGGTSGITYTIPYTSVMGMVTLTSAADLAAFTGAGSIVLPTTGVGSSSASGAGNLITQFSTLAGADGQIMYTYTTAAVPEPASWAMLIAGFGLTGAAMRRRRTAVAA